MVPYNNKVFDLVTYVNIFLVTFYVITISFYILLSYLNYVIKGRIREYNNSTPKISYLRHRISYYLCYRNGNRNVRSSISISTTCILWNVMLDNSLSIIRTISMSVGNTSLFFTKRFLTVVITGIAK